VDADLFDVEMRALNRAQAMLDAPQVTAEDYRMGLEDLLQHYRRLTREMHRLIRHGDRTEAELSAANARLQQLTEALNFKARHDSLTGTLNRGAVFEQAQAQLDAGALALILLDIDFFKQINDRYGHPAGDAVLRELVERLDTALNGRGVMGRVGGEEFTILLPETSLAESVAFAESLRCCVGDRAFSCLPGQFVTASFGVGWNPRGTTFEVAYASADEALYRAKQQGRNTVRYQGSTVTNQLMT
jgi:diguanylate cyclase (GGDEF)-like protein